MKETNQPGARSRFLRFLRPGLTKPLTKDDLEAQALEVQQRAEQFWGPPTNDNDPKETRRRLVDDSQQYRGSSRRITQQLSRLERFPEAFPAPRLLTESDFQFLSPDFPNASEEELERLVYESNPDIYADRLTQNALASINEQSSTAQIGLHAKAEQVEREKAELYASQPPTLTEWSVNNLPWYAAVNLPNETPSLAQEAPPLPPISRFENLSSSVDLDRINATTRMRGIVHEARSKGGFTSFQTRDGEIDLPTDETLRTEFLVTLQRLNTK